MGARNAREIRGRRRAPIHRACAALIVTGLAAGALAAGAEDRRSFLGGDPEICAAPGPDLFHDDFESGDGCRWSLSNPADPFCPPAECGDGLLHAGEACDDGNLTDETTCAYGLGTCTCCAEDCSGLLLLGGPFCGDSQVDTGAGEVCDDGNAVTELECAYGIGPCLACNRFCTEELSLPARYCGDSTIDADDGEACDDGNDLDETQCPYGTPTCTRCSTSCTVLNLTGGVCGDGDLDSGFEVCDDGNTVTEAACPYGQSACSGCSADCQSSLALGGGVCGDGVLDAPWEDCDDGNAAACGTCSSDCQTVQSAAASGYLVAVAGGALADGETFTVNDGSGGSVFEFDFDFDVPPGRVSIAIVGSETAGQVAAKVVTAINASPQGLQAISAGSALVQILHGRATSLGNQPILETVANPELEVSGLAGGLGGDCPDGFGCGSSDDCASGLCIAGVCTPP